MPRWLQTYEIARKYLSPNVHNDIKQFSNYEKELETLIKVVRIYRIYIGVKCDIKKCAMLITRSGKRQMTEGIEQPNQKKKNYRICGEKEAYLYLGISEEDTNKQAERKKKLKKNISGKRENTRNQTI